MSPYPKRLIEVDLPIKRISAHARREKSIRHGHISTLHIWWARRPLAACRAVICAALWPDPADELCPPAFRQAAAHQIHGFVEKVVNDKALAESCDQLSFARWNTLSRPEGKLDLSKPAHLTVLRDALLDFIADFANWDNSTVPAYLETSRALTQAAHEALGGLPGTRPLVVDPFAGGGAIPLEALRVGADAFASDLNPVAVLLNKVVLEYIPKYGDQLADEVRKWGDWIKREAEKELAQFYPNDPDGATPIAYLWARTIRCEGPGCGTEVPLMRSLWLAKKGSRWVALQLVPSKKNKRVDFEIIEKRGNDWVSQANPQNKIKNPQFDGTVKRGSATCPVCGYTTPVASIRRQLRERNGGALDARLFCVVSTKTSEQGRYFRLPSARDLAVIKDASSLLDAQVSNGAKGAALTLVPDEPTPSSSGHRAVASVALYGNAQWGDIFSHRQRLMLTTFTRLVHDLVGKLSTSNESGLPVAVQTILAFAVDREAEHSSTLCRWNSSGPKMQATFSRQALPMTWDYAETNPFGGSVGSWDSMLECVLIPFETISSICSSGHAEHANAMLHPLPDESAQAFITDPPYYDSVPYADLADFFYVWLRRTIGKQYPGLLNETLTPKLEQAIVWHPGSSDEKNAFESKMRSSMAEGQRILVTNGIGVIVFAHKSTSGWEAQLNAMIDAGWTVTASWPVDTEMANRMNAMGTASLVSSIHLICRPREQSNEPHGAAETGDWRDILTELPKRIHDWMPRLAQEGVVGADAIFACLGPALEIFSQYARVERASGEQVTLKEYLEYVWAAVAREALSMIFTGADTTGFEEDSRLTAMWLWTLTTKDEGDKAKVEDGAMTDEGETVEDDEEESRSGSKVKPGGFIMEYDAARKIAQGLGAHLEQLTSLIEVKGNKARLLPVAERAEHLFGKDEGKAPAKSKKKVKQRSFFETAEDGDSGDDGWGEMSAPKLGVTVLDHVHQSMILFAAGRADALKRFLIDENAGSDQRFWRLAQAFSALYPSSSDEKRWVDGVLARKKGLGF